MIVVTTPYMAGHRIVESKGMVFGLVVRSRGIGGDLMAGLRSIAGGEIHEYTSLLEDTRRQALDRLVQNATLQGANGIISMRFDSSQLSGTMSEIVAYGTAVVVEPDASAPTAVDERIRLMGLTLSRALVILFGIVIAAMGLLLFATGPGFPIAGLVTFGAGVILVIGALIERLRYRSASAERSAEAPGPGGGEPLDRPMDGRFVRTDERFVDPTTHASMRVWLDPTTGERRYRAEE